MSDYKKPLPVIQPHSEEFWEATKQSKLLLQQCQDCNTLQDYPRKFCAECWSDNMGWKESSGKGKIYSYSITYEGVEPMFQEDLPLSLAWVDLEEGVRFNTNIHNCDPDTLEIGMDVEVIFEKVTDDVTLPFFQPVGA